jgi:hypothetical protein
MNIFSLAGADAERYYCLQERYGEAEMFAARHNCP